MSELVALVVLGVVILLVLGRLAVTGIAKDER